MKELSGNAFMFVFDWFFKMLALNTGIYIKISQQRKKKNHWQLFKTCWYLNFNINWLIMKNKLFFLFKSSHQPTGGILLLFLYFVVGGRTMWYERFFFSCKKSEAFFTRNCWIYLKTMATRHSWWKFTWNFKGALHEWCNIASPLSLTEKLELARNLQVTICVKTGKNLWR